MKNRSLLKKGLSIVEIIIFIFLFSIFFTTIVSAISASILSYKNQELKTKATIYAEELIEWLKGEKEANWQNFFSKASTNGEVYCFNQTPIDNWPKKGICQDYSLDDAVFKRKAIVKSVSDDQVETEILIEWRDVKKENFIKIKTIFNQWE